MNKVTVLQQHRMSTDLNLSGEAYIEIGDYGSLIVRQGGTTGRIVAIFAEDEWSVAQLGDWAPTGKGEDK